MAGETQSAETGQFASTADQGERKMTRQQMPENHAEYIRLRNRELARMTRVAKHYAALPRWTLHADGSIEAPVKEKHSG
jgi:hypothetical protein